MDFVSRLPLELLFDIASRLSFEGLCALSFSCSGLYKKLMLSEAVCAGYLAEFAPKAKEATLARLGHIPAGSALASIYGRHRRWVDARPRTVRAVGTGSDFLYSEGVLCVLGEKTVHLSGIQSVSPLSLVCSLRRWLRRGTLPRSCYKLLHFSRGILSLEIRDGTQLRVLAFDTTAKNGKSDWTLRVNALVGGGEGGEGSEVAIRNDENFLVIIQIRHDRRRLNSTWVLKTFGICDGSVTKRPSGVWAHRASVDDTLDELGRTTVIEVIDRSLWIMSSQRTQKPDAASSKGYYAGCRYDLTRDSVELDLWRVFRRHHADGPINGLWSKMSLGKNERGQYVIVESRREWLAGQDSLDSLRSFYTTTIESRAMNIRLATFEEALQSGQHPIFDDDEDEDADADEDEEDEEEDILASDQPLSRHRPVRVVSRHKHAEAVDAGGNNTAPAHAVELRETLYSGYDASSLTFVDVVNVPTADGMPRIGFRTGQKGAGFGGAFGGGAVGPVNLWLPTKCSRPAPAPAPGSARANLEAGLFPAKAEHLATFRAVQDERSIVLSTRHAEDAPVVAISFDQLLSARNGLLVDESSCSVDGSDPVEFVRLAL